MLKAEKDEGDVDMIEDVNYLLDTKFAKFLSLDMASTSENTVNTESQESECDIMNVNSQEDTVIVKQEPDIALPKIENTETVDEVIPGSSSVAKPKGKNIPLETIVIMSEDIKLSPEMHFFS